MKNYVCRLMEIINRDYGENFFFHFKILFHIKSARQECCYLHILQLNDSPINKKGV